MSVKLLTEHHLEFLSLKGGCTGLSESSLVKMPYCWKTIYMMEISCRDSCVLIICMMGILSCYCNMLNFFIEFFQEHYQSVKRFVPRSVNPVLGPNCLQRSSADNKKQ